MATPVGHSLVAGLFFFSRGDRGSRGFPLFLIFLLLANGADLDFLPGILLGEPSRFHHGISHSFGFGLIFTAVVCGILKFIPQWFQKRDWMTFFLTGYTLYLSHLLVDWFTLDNGQPYGMPIFWPISNSYITSAIYIFPNVLHGEGSLNWHNIMVAIRELVVFGPAMLFLCYGKAKLPKWGFGLKLLIVSLLLGIPVGIMLRTNPFY